MTDAATATGDVMSTQAKGTFQLKSFDEDTVEEFAEGGKLTRARIVQIYTGDLDGEAASALTMLYRPDGTATYVGFQRFTGTVGDRSGSYLEQVTGGYDNTEARSTSQVLDGTGTGDLAGLRGTGTSAAPHGSTGTYTLDYDLG
jgi:Protein of unknown function (DUF3224)